MNFVKLERLWSRFNENSMAFMLRQRIVICLVKVCGKRYLDLKSILLKRKINYVIFVNLIY